MRLSIRGLLSYSSGAWESPTVPTKQTSWIGFQLLFSPRFSPISNLTSTITANRSKITWMTAGWIWTMGGAWCSKPSWKRIMSNSPTTYLACFTLRCQTIFMRDLRIYISLLTSPRGLERVCCSVRILFSTRSTTCTTDRSTHSREFSKILEVSTTHASLLVFLSIPNFRALFTCLP